MPYLKDQMAKSKALAEAPTLGNLHPDARAQAIARAGIVEAEAVRRRLQFLHSAAAVDADGYEWGIFRVKWENGRAVDVQRTRADHADLDAAIQDGCDYCRHPLFLGSSCSSCGAVLRALDDEDPRVMSALNVAAGDGTAPAQPDIDAYGKPYGTENRMQLPPGYSVWATDVKASEERGAYTCRACGFRGFWKGGPHCGPSGVPGRDGGQHG